jgi:hypothetical protein
MNRDAIAMAVAVKNRFVIAESRKQQNRLPESLDYLFASLITTIAFPGNPAVRFTGAIIRQHVGVETR